MSTVTVQSAHSSTVSLSYDSDANALLATFVRDAISAGINGGSIQPYASAVGPTPALPTGKTGEWVQSSPGSVLLGHGWDYIVMPDTATAANITGPSDPNVHVLAGSGNLVFNAAQGSGSVIAGGGNNSVLIPLANPGAWFIGMGNGSDTVRALGSGNDTISLGSGADSIQLGAGSSAVTTGGAATITGSSLPGGSETVFAFGSDVVFGMASKLVFSGAMGATVFGGSGSDTVSGGTGLDLFQAGTGGGSSLTGGAGSVTLLGGGSADQLTATGTGLQILTAASSNETLTGSSASGASNVYRDNTSGATTVVASPNASSNLFAFIEGSAGGSLVETGLTAVGQIQMHLTGYGSDDTSAISQNNSGGNLNVTLLSDGTTITFKNITAPLTNGNFV
jgi:hypothetical protein